MLAPLGKFPDPKKGMTVNPIILWGLAMHIVLKYVDF